MTTPEQDHYDDTFPLYAKLKMAREYLCRAQMLDGEWPCPVREDEAAILRGLTR